MSKYNLTDILEQYKIGSGWTSDFDYDGMLKAGLETGVDTDIEVLKKMSDDFEDVNYHRENSHLQNAIEALEDGATKEASMFFGDFHAEIKATMKEQGMDIEPTVGQFMQNYIKEDLFSKDGDNEDNVDNIDKVASPDAKGKGYDSSVAAQSKESGDEMDQITQTTKPMYKENKVPSLEEVYNIDRKGNEKPDTDGSDASKYKKAARDMKENKALGYLDKEVSDRIEGMLNIPMKKKFMDIGMDLIQDLLEEDPFDIDDIITHLANELGAYLDSFYAQGDRLNSIPMEENGDVKDYAEEIKEASAEESIADYIIDYYTNPKTGEKIIDDDIVMAYFKTHPDYMDRFDGTPEGMKDGLDDFQEFLFVNYDIPGAGEIDEAKKMEDLKEHFNRFK